MEITRLFDFVTYYKENYADFPVAFAHKSNGEWIKYSAKDFFETVDNVSYAFLKMGLQKGEKVAVISGNRAEWNFLDYGLQQIGGILVPIYPTISENDYKHILTHSEVKYVFVEGLELLKKIENILPEITNIQGIFTFKDQKRYEYFETLVNLGKENPQAELLKELKDSIKAEDMTTLLYTSGTTGTPKGVMLSHANIVSNVMGVRDVPEAKVGQIAMSYLPLCHIYERMMNYCWQYLGLPVYYSDLGSIVPNTQDVKPVIMCSIPRVLEKVYDKIYTAGEKLPFIQKNIYYWALKLALKYELEGRGLWYNLQYAIANKLIYGKWRAVLGGQLDTIVSGGASLQPRLARMFTAIGVRIIEGYGLTETSPVIAVSNFRKNGRKFGTVGPPLFNVEVKISDDGEILTRGPHIMMGYYKDEEATKLAIEEDGWFHTGDIGQLEPEGQLRITGRKKSVFKTSFGKYVNPQVIEEKFKESPFIEQIIVVGEGQKFAAALITPNFPFLKAWWERKEFSDACPTTFEEFIESKQVKDRIKKEIDKYNKFFGATEQVKKIKLIPAEWSPETKELTQTMKLRRLPLEEKYKEEIAALFV